MSLLTFNAVDLFWVKLAMANYWCINSCIDRNVTKWHYGIWILYVSAKWLTAWALRGQGDVKKKKIYINIYIYIYLFTAA